MIYGDHDNRFVGARMRAAEAMIDERRREYAEHIKAVKPQQDAEEANQEGRTRAGNTNIKNTVEDSTIVDTASQQSISERSALPAEPQARNKTNEKKQNKKPSTNLPSWEESLNKWAPSWKKTKSVQPGDFEKIVQKTYEEMNRPTEVVTERGVEVSTRANQAKAVTDELNKLKYDYDKRRSALEKQKQRLLDQGNLRAASIYTSEIPQDKQAEIDKINNQITQLDDEYVTKREMIRKYTSRGGISADSFNRLATEKYKDDIVLRKQLSDQHSAMLNDPNADPDELKAISKRVNNLDWKIRTRETKLEIIEKYIKAHGLPKSIQEFPEYVQDVAYDVLSEGGILDAGIMAPSQVSEIGKRIREYSEQSKGSMSSNSVSIDEQAKRLKEQTLNEMRMIEEAHGISKGFADYENIDSSDGVLGRVAHGFRSAPIGWGLTAAYQLALGKDRERYNQLVESIHTVDKALKYQEINDMFYKESDAKRSLFKNEASNLSLSFWKNALDPSIWDFGVNDISRAMKLSEIRSVQDRGGRYTPEQRDLLNAMALDAVLHDKYSEYEKAWGYQAGETFAQSLPFMLDMLLGSHGLASLEKATTKQGVKKVTQFLTGETGKAMQRAALKEAVEQYGTRGVQATIARNVKEIPGLLTRLSGDAINALLLANTVQGAKTASDIMNLHTGLIDYSIGEGGVITGTGFKNALTWTEATRQAETRAWIENFSEALGEYNVFTNTFRPLNRMLTKANKLIKDERSLVNILGVDTVAKKALRYAKTIQNTIDTIQKHNPFAGKKARDFLHAARYHGFVGESLEEYYGMALEHGLDVSDSEKSFWQDITSADNFWNIVGGIALSQVVLGTAGGVHVLSARNRYKHAQNNASNYFGKNWEAMENAIVNASSENVSAVVKRLADSITEVDGKQALFDYYTELMSYRAASYSEQAAQQDRDSSNHAKAVRDSYQTGYMVNTQNARNDLDSAIEAVKQNLNSTFGVKDIDIAIEDNGGVDELVSRLDDRNLSNLLLAYDNMLATRDGMVQRQNDDIDIMLDQAEHDVMRLRYRDGRNKILAAQLKNGKTVFVTNRDIDSSKVTVTGFNGERFEIDDDDIAVDERGIQIIDEYDTGEFIASQRQKILSDYMQRDDARGKNNPDLRTGTSVRLASGKLLTILGTTRDGGVLYSVRDGFKTVATDNARQTVFKAESTAKMADIIKDANEERKNEIVSKYIEDAEKEQQQNDQDKQNTGIIQGVIADSVAQDMANYMNMRIDETSRRTTAYIPSGRVSDNEETWGNFSQDKATARRTYDRAVNAIQHAQDAKSFTEFAQKLEQAGLAIPFQYGGRLQMLYKAFVNGEIAAKQFALVFVNEKRRKDVYNKKSADAFNSLEFDSEGNIIEQKKQRKRPKTAQNSPITSVSQDQPAVTPTQPKTSATQPEIQPQSVQTAPAVNNKPEQVQPEPAGTQPPVVPPTPPKSPAQESQPEKPEEFIDISEFDPSNSNLTKLVADWAKQAPNNGRVKVLERDGDRVLVEYIARTNEGDQLHRSWINIKTNAQQPETPVETTPVAQPTVAGAVQAADSAVLDNDRQQKAIDALLKKIEEDKDKVRVDLRTGHDYFIMIGGKLVMYPRVHSVLDPQYPDTSSKISKKQTIKNQLFAVSQQAIMKRDYSEFDKLAKQFAKEHNDKFPNEEAVDVQIYLDYFRNNPLEVNEIVEAIADLCSNETVHISVKYGNIMDEICRKFFDKQRVLYEDYQQYMSKELFDKIINQLEAIQKIYDDRGWKLVSKPVYLYSELQDGNGRPIRVAGETDMIAVDKDGKYHIIDFKTSYKTFVHRLSGPRLDVVYDRFSQELPIIRDRDMRQAKRTYRQQYSNQLTVYSTMLDDNLGGNTQSISILPWHLNYDRWSPDVYFEDASNFDVRLNEDRTNYVMDSEGHAILMPVLIELEKVNDVLKLYGSRKPADTNKTKKANAATQAQINAMSEVLANNDGVVTDDVKSAAEGLIQDQNKVIEAAAQTDDPVVHKNAQAAAENNANQANQLQQIAEQQATAAAQQEISNTAANAQKEAKQEVVVQDWKQHTTTHTHSLDGSIGIEDAVAIDDASKKLSYVTGEPDFVTKGKFVFGTINWKGQIKLTVQVTYKGVTYQPVTISTSRNPLGNKFYGKVMNALREAKSGQIVVPTIIRRTNGEMRPGDPNLMTTALPGRKPLVSANPNEGEMYLYDVQLGPQFGRIVQQGSMYTIVVPGVNGGKNQPIFTFSNKTEGLAGMYAMILDLNYEEPGSQHRFPIFTKTVKMTDGDAQLIIDILNGVYTASKTKDLSANFVDNGVDYGMTNLQVLNLLLPFGQQTGPDKLHIEYDTLSKDAVKIIGKVEGSDVVERVFYLNTPSGVQDLKKFLTKNVNKNLSDTVMQHRLGSRAKSPFSGLLGFLNSASGQQILQQKKQVQFGQSSIIFDLDDFKDPSNPNDKQGLTGLGWYIKRGFIETYYNGIYNTLLDFENTANVDTIDDVPQPTPTAQQVVNNPVETAIEEVHKEDSNTNALTDRLDVEDLANTWNVDYLDKRITRDSDQSNLIKEDEARKNLEKLFGENGVQVEFIDDVIAMMRSGAQVVGRCYADCIILSRKAEAGVEYHEAFHRVVELLLTDKQRAKVYAAFRNAKKGRKNLTDRQIAESLADNFMYFMMNRPTFKFTFNLKKMFGQISDWVRMLNNIGSLRLTYLYLTTANGRFRNVQPTAEAKARFDAFAKYGLNFTKRGKELPNILNERHYRTLVKSIIYLFMNPSTQHIEWTGANISELRIDKDLAMQSAIWKQWMEPIGTKNGEPVYRIPYETRAALQDMMDNWDAVQDDIAMHIAQFSTDYNIRYEEQNQNKLDTTVPEVTSPNNSETAADDDDPASAGAEAVDGHIKASYEFNPFSRTSDKVKFFFAAIPDYTLDSGGRKIPVLNECGLPQLLPATLVYARMLNDMHTISGVDDLRKELKRLGQKDYMYQIISRRFESLWDTVVPEKGKEVDYDAEQLIAQITQTVRQNKNIFEVAKMRKDKDGYTVDIVASDSGYTARKFTKDWAQQFAAGAGLFVRQDKNGSYVMKNGMPVRVFTEFCNQFNGPNGMLQALAPENQNPKPFKIQGIEIDANNPAHIELCKNFIVRQLSFFGINFERAALDYTLLHQYQDIGAEGIYKFLTDTKYGGFSKFLTFVASLNYNNNLNLNDARIEEFSNLGFLVQLANYKYAYRHSFDQMSVLATDNKTFYVMSENNYLTDRLFELQNDSNELMSAQSDPYIYLAEKQTVGEDETYGSIVIDHIANNRENLEIATLIGFSSAESGVDDVDYAQMSAREDYIAKFSALLSGRMIFPTQSDKKTWGYVKGLMLPGLNFKDLQNTMPTKKGRIVSDDVLKVLIGYAKTEDAAITRFLAEHSSIASSEAVENYDGGTTVTEKLPNGKEVKHTVLQGGRFGALLGVWDGDTFIEFNRLFDENGVYQTEEMCQRRAHEYFFDKSEEEQLDIMNTILLKQVEQEMEYICELGLIKSADKLSESNSNILGYENVGLDYRKVRSVYNLLQEKYPKGNAERLQRTALMMVVGDVVAKGMISMNEYERVFCGQPTFFKFKYDEDGHLVNRTDDQSKRLGGLVSTGFNNVMLPGIKEDYVCAEVSDEKISQDSIEEIYKLTYEGTVRQTYLRDRLSKEGVEFEDLDRAAQIAEESDKMSIEEIENTFDDTVKAIIKQSVDAKVGAFKKINVTDGASYISEEMCKNLLRMAGSFSGEVKRAFDILTGKEVDGKVYTTKDIRELAQAYQTVTTSVIGAQKYTAYGFRERKFTDENGNTTITHIPYYNKTALFPLFKSISTGPLADLYQQMLDNKIDMIMMHSAVKVGGQGQVPVNWVKTITHPQTGEQVKVVSDKKGEIKVDGESYRIATQEDLNGPKFNTYTQKIKYLRKQFNTDPKEKEEMSVGTQMKKVALSTLTPGRTYNVGGESLNATQVRNRIMDSLNAISDLGEDEIMEMFYTDDKFDVNKFSKVLTKELIGRGASAEMIDAVSVENGELKTPLSALSGMNWIQSIIKSMIDKRVVDTNTPGKAFYQRSVWGMEGHSILSDDNIPPSINGGRKLQVNNEDGSMDVVLSIDYYEDVLKKAKVKTGRKIKKTRKVKRNEYDTYEKYGIRYTDYTKTHEVEVEEEYEADEYISVFELPFEKQRQWLIDHKLIGGPKFDENGNAIPGTGASASIIGYRIPTQAISSIHAMRCVDVLPVVRDTIIMPAAITSITGSDFDIDKMFLSRLYINANGGTDFKKDSHEWHANRLISAYLAVLKDQKNSFQDLNGSIDNDTSFLTEVRDDLREGQKTEPLMPYSAYMLREQSATKNVFVTGKFGIGPFALNNNMHILMQLYGVKFSEETSSIMTELGLTKLGGFADRYGKSILSWFSGLINAHVDAAKDPWIPELNVNKYTYNLVSMLIHAGLGKDTFYFTTQPVMKQLAIAYQNANGIYMNDQSKSKTDLIEEAEDAVIQNLINAHNDWLDETDPKNKRYASIFDYWNKQPFSQIGAIKALFEKDSQVMRNVAKKHFGEKGSIYKNLDDISFWVKIEGKDYNITAFDVQMIVATANQLFKPHAEALSNLVQHTKIDTKKQGKNILEQRKYLNGVAELFDPTAMGDSRLLFDEVSLDNMYKNSYIKHQTELATQLFKKVLANQMIEATSKFSSDVDKLLLTVGNFGKDPKIINTAQKAILAKIKSKYFFGRGGYCERYEIKPETLVSGNNTIYDKLLNVKIMLLNDPKYLHLIDRRTGEPVNYLLRALVSGNKYNYDGGAKFIQPLGFVMDDAFNPDDLSQAWDDLLQDSKYPELQQFARELVVYAFITSGDNGGKNDLFKYVPNTWRLGRDNSGNEDTSYATYMKEQHAKYVQGLDVLNEQDFEDIILNNWHEDSIIPKVNLYKKNVAQFQTFTSEKDGRGIPLVMAAIDAKGNCTVKHPKMYIKIPRPGSDENSKGKSRYVVYKRIGNGISKNGTAYPVYAMVDQKGSVFDKRERVLEHWDVYGEAEQLVSRSLKNTLNLLSLTANTTEEAVNAIADYVNAHNTKLSVLISEGYMNESLASIIYGINRSRQTTAQQEQQPVVIGVNSYEGEIVPDGNTIIVFGSNPQGIHGAGSAKVAKNMFKAQVGVGEGMTGNAYAIPTKDLEASKGTEWYNPGDEQREKVLEHYRVAQSGFTFDPSNITYDEVKSNPVKRTISPENIVESIKRMYEVAEMYPDKQFKVAYMNGLTEITRNGYIGAEMIAMFKEAGPIPSNVFFSTAWVSSGMFNQTVQNPEVTAPGTYDMPSSPQQPMEIWYGSSDNDPNRSNPDLSNFAERPFKIKGSVIGAPGSNEEYEFKSVERAFQAAKVFYTDMLAEERDQWFKSIQNAATSAKAKQLGGEVPKLDVTDWNTYKYEILKDLIKASFEQNETARNRLLSTGNAELTHTRGGKEYSREFPRILMEVREELRAEQNGVQEERKPRLIKKGSIDYENVYQNMTDSEYEEWKKNNNFWDNDGEFPKDDMNHCKGERL